MKELNRFSWLLGDFRLMENMNEEIDLGLALGVTNQRFESCSDTGAGANANLRSRIDTNAKPFVGPCPLTELVWSRQNGLTVKCAGGTRCFTDANDEKRVIDGSFLRSSLGHTGSHSRKTADLLPLLANEPEKVEIKTENNDRFALDVGLPLKMQDMTQRGEELLKEEGTSNAPFLEKMEETAENDVQDLIVKDSILENDQKKGEDSLMKEQNKEGGCEEDDDESHESMESCNSANLSSKKNKGWRFDEQLIIGSKRIKKQSQQYCPVVRQDSSFMNWISNMVKGEKPYQEDSPRQFDDDQNKRLGFQTVFQSLYSNDPKRIETKTQIEGKSVNDSKEIILFDKNTVSEHNPDDTLNQKAFGNLWITRVFPKLPSNDSSAINASSFGLKQFEKLVEKTCFFCGKTGHELRDCLKTNENGNVFFNKKVPNFNEIASSSGKNKLLNEEKIHGIPQRMFDTIRKLRLSRTEILKWMNSRLPVANLHGYFLRLRLAKWEEGVGGAGYYVACITDENPSKGSKKPIRVNIGGVECLVESRYISNCDFIEDELIAWWQRTLTSGRVPMEEGLTSKLEEREKLGF